jgi:transposase
MLTLPPRVKVFAAVAPTDMRKSFDGLVGIVEKELGQNVEDGDLFLFFNRRRDRLKVLYFTGDGLVILYKKLERGTFEMLRAPQRTDTALSSRDDSPSSSTPCLSLRGQELTLLLEGIELSSVKHRKWWRQDRS